MYPIHAFGSEEQRQQVPAAHGEGRADRLLRPHRAARRLRSGQHEDAREAPRPRLGAERREDVDHERAHRGSRGRLGDDRGRHPRLHRREGHEGICDAGDRAQVLAARLRHRRALLRGRRRARGEHAAGQYRRPQGAALLPDAGALRHHLGRHRRRAGLPRAVDRLHEDPRAVRSSARGEPGDPDPARRRWRAASRARSSCRCSSVG